MGVSFCANNIGWCEPEKVEPETAGMIYRQRRVRLEHSGLFGSNRCLFFLVGLSGREKILPFSGLLSKSSEKDLFINVSRSFFFAMCSDSSSTRQFI